MPTNGQREGGFVIETKIMFIDPLTAFQTSLKERLGKKIKKRPKAQPTPGKEENPLGRRAPTAGPQPLFLPLIHRAPQRSLWTPLLHSSGQLPKLLHRIPRLRLTLIPGVQDEDCVLKNIFTFPFTFGAVPALRDQSIPLGAGRR